MKVLNSKPVIGLGIFVMLSLAMVFAGNVFVKDGSVNVDNNFNVSNDLYIDGSTGKVGIGTSSPGYGIDVEKVTGLTFAKFGSSLPVYITANNPTLGFNVYYNGGWKFGKGSSSNYAGVLEFLPASGDLNFQTSSSTGNADATATMQRKMTLKQSGDLGIGTDIPNSKLQVNGPIATAINIVTSTYTVTASDSVVVASSSYFTINLPTALGISGREYTIKRAWNNNAPGSITIDAYSTQTIDGSATYSLASAGKYVQIVSDGSNWVVVGNN